MPLVYSATSGVAGDLVPLVTPTGSVAARVLEVAVLGPTGPTGPTGPAGSIPPGSYDGQPVKWDGATYVPLPAASPLVLQTLRADSSGLIELLSADGIQLAADLQMNIQAPAGPITITSDRITISTATSVQIVPGSLGFFGAPPVAQPVITGTLQQDQIDSIAAALVALGLSTDTSGPVSPSAIAKQIGWLPAAGNSNLMVCLAAPHPAGLYIVSRHLVRTTASTSGTVIGTISYSTPIFGATSNATAATATNVTGPVGVAPVIVVSSGTAPITVQWVPTLIVGAPVIDAYNSAVLQALL